MPVPQADTSRHDITSPDGTRLSVLVALPPPGIVRAAGLPPILAVHGFASNARSGWQRTGHLDALTRAGRVVIAPDLRGHGRSDKPHRARDYTLPAMLADLVAVTEAAADAALAGPGPAVTVSPGSEAPDRAVTMPRASGTGDGSPGPVDLLGYSLGARLCWALAVDDLLHVRRLVLGGFDGRPLFQGVDTDRLDRLAAGVPGNDREALRCLVAGLSGTGGTPRAGRLPGVPALLVAGDADPLATRARQFAERLPHGSFLSVPGRNHISAVPASAFRRAVVEFLASHGEGAGGGAGGGAGQDARPHPDRHAGPDAGRGAGGHGPGRGATGGSIG